FVLQPLRHRVSLRGHRVRGLQPQRNHQRRQTAEQQPPAQALFFATHLHHSTVNTETPSRSARATSAGTTPIPPGLALTRSLVSLSAPLYSGFFTSPLNNSC